VILGEGPCKALSNPFGLCLFYISSLRKQAFFRISVKQTTPLARDLIMLCGERGIRTPGTLLRYTRFPGVPIKPLLHLSKFKNCFQKTGAQITKIFLQKPCQDISPANDLFNDSTTFSLDEYLPSRCISFVTEASDVMSFPLTIPAASI
jgi:hypothetical protein